MNTGSFLAAKNKVFVGVALGVGLGGFDDVVEWSGGVVGYVMGVAGVWWQELSAWWEWSWSVSQSFLLVRSILKI